MNINMNINVIELINSDLASKQAGIFVLILLRTSIFMAMMPLFSSSNSPAQFKLGIAVALAFVLTPVVQFEIKEGNNYVSLIVREIILSMFLGGAVRLAFVAVNIAGQMMSNGMALSIATSFDPEFGQSAEISRLLGILATLLFFAMDIHHDLIYIFARSFEVVPPGQVNLSKLMIYGMFGGLKVFVLAIKLAAPVMIAMVVLNFLLGFLYKASPQINIFFVSFPLFIFVGFIVMLLSIPPFFQVIADAFENIRDEMHKVLVMGKG
ncbi:Type III secretion system inner membrane R protein [Candidatus Magnetobacterium bavaricum]|uniref:Type III secretion system inner membrane R protein n=1 Tax=Candidatus Magnetobacterium bavaricum TaxID=29290 RepID=A0A0F3H295_9BACT|nr:Type III secretion system inner membrane R protein [Candidatus Magnetobacterium bavaricum]